MDEYGIIKYRGENVDDQDRIFLLQNGYRG